MQNKKKKLKIFGVFCRYWILHNYFLNFFPLNFKSMFIFFLKKKVSSSFIYAGEMSKWLGIKNITEGKLAWNLGLNTLNFYISKISVQIF